MEAMLILYLNLGQKKQSKKKIEEEVWVQINRVVKLLSPALETEKERIPNGQEVQILVHQILFLPAHNLQINQSLERSRFS
jgi:hypothetical protein